MKLTALLFGLAFTVSNACMAETPTSSCEKPILPNKQSSEMVIKGFNKRLLAYKKCIDQFAGDQYKFANESKDPVASQKANDAAATAINEFNQLLSDVAEVQGSTGGNGATPINVTYKGAPPPPPVAPK